MVLMLFVMAAWFGYDGYRGWPKENVEINRLQQELKEAKGDPIKEKILNDLPKIHDKPHSDSDLMFQKILCGVLPIAGIAMLVWTRFNSRGTYSMKGHTVSVPGHENINFGQITEIDNRKWEKKGIAYVKYNTTEGVEKKFRIDDFIYERAETDIIYDALVAHLVHAGGKIGGS